MRNQLLLIILCICLSISASAQVAVNFNGDDHKQTNQTQAKLSTGQSLTISPNPLLKENAILQVTTVDVDYYSFKVVSATGQIVELENLSGRPDSDIIDLNGAVIPGLYIIIFETNAGKITRKFNVI